MYRHQSSHRGQTLRAFRVIGGYVFHHSHLVPVDLPIVGRTDTHALKSYRFDKSLNFATLGAQSQRVMVGNNTILQQAGQSGRRSLPDGLASMLTAEAIQKGGETDIHL